MKKVVNNKILNELEEDINEKSLDAELKVNCADLDATASELYAKQESFSKFSDDELLALAVMCQICKENPYGKEYDDEVFDELNDRANKNELLKKLDELAPKYCHSFDYVSTEDDKDMTYDTTSKRHWYVVYMTSGTVKYPLMWYETQQEAENFCNENGWEWEDEIGFEWSLDIDEIDASEDELMSKQLVRDTENDKYDVDYDDGFDDDYDEEKNDEYKESYDLLSGTHVECYSDYYIAKSRAEELGLKEAEYGDTKTWSFCSWNETGDRNDDEKVIAYYKFVDGKPCALNETERENVAKEFDFSFDNKPE